MMVELSYEWGGNCIPNYPLRCSVNAVSKFDAAAFLSIHQHFFHQYSAGRASRVYSRLAFQSHVRRDLRNQFLLQTMSI